MSIFFEFSSFKKEILSSNFKFSKKIIGVDYGTKKIGISMCDDNLLIAFKKDVLIGNWFDLNKAKSALINECEKYNTYILVFGFPKNLDGSLNKNCERILQIIKLLDHECKKNNKHIAILLFDERFSTKATKSVFNTRIAKNTSYKKKIDKIDDPGSACIILNDVLKLMHN